MARDEREGSAPTMDDGPVESEADSQPPSVLPACAKREMLLHLHH